MLQLNLLSVFCSWDNLHLRERRSPHHVHLATQWPAEHTGRPAGSGLQHAAEGGHSGQGGECERTGRLFGTAHSKTGGMLWACIICPWLILLLECFIYLLLFWSNSSNNFLFLDITLTLTIVVICNIIRKTKMAKTFRSSPKSDRNWLVNQSVFLFHASMIINPNVFFIALMC